jgi:hypothetical protein
MHHNLKINTWALTILQKDNTEFIEVVQKWNSLSPQSLESISQK